MPPSPRLSPGSGKRAPTATRNFAAATRCPLPTQTHRALKCHISAADVADAPGRSISKHDITGVVLAGGRGSRMGGVDKGLQPLNLEPLALHALRRLKPQCGAMLISANRTLEISAQL